MLSPDTCWESMVRKLKTCEFIVRCRFIHYAWIEYVANIKRARRGKCFLLTIVVGDIVSVVTIISQKWLRFSNALCHEVSLTAFHSNQGKHTKLSVLDICWPRSLGNSCSVYLLSPPKGFSAEKKDDGLNNPPCSRSLFDIHAVSQF